VGEDQAEDIEEETPVVDALLGSREKQVPSKLDHQERRDAGPSQSKQRKLGVQGKFSAPSHLSLDPSPRDAAASRSRPREPAAPLSRQPGGIPPPGFLPNIEGLAPPLAVKVPKAAADPTALRLDQLERQLKEGLIATIETVLANQLAGSIRQKLVSEITASLETGVVQEVIKRFKLFFTGQVKDVVKAEVKCEIKAEVSKELRAEFQKEIIDARQVTSRLAGSHDNLRKLVGEDVEASVMDSLRAEFSGQLGQARHANAMIKDNLEPLKKQIKAELKSDIEQRIRKELPSIFRNDIKDEVVREIHDEIGNPLKRQLAADLAEEIRHDVKEQLRSYMKQKVRMAYINASPEAPVHLVFVDFNNLWAIADRFTASVPKLKRILDLLQSTLHEYDDQFLPARLSGFIFFSKYHEQNVARFASAPSFDDAELNEMRQQFILEVEEEKKMLQNGQERNYRDVDVLLAARAAELIAKGKNRVASVTIVGGDGDFNPVLDIARKLGIYTIVFAFKQGMSSSLRYNADECHYLNKPSKADP
jgi:uncharacterized LabA/DUF88 family protein